MSLQLAEGDVRPLPLTDEEVQRRVDALVAELQNLAPWVSHGQRAQICAAVQSALPERPADALTYELFPGHRTTLTGLGRRRELNGVVVTLTGWVDASERWEVCCCRNGEVLSVRPCNLMPQPLLPDLVGTVLQTAELPYAEAILKYLWPQISGFARVCRATLGICLDVARRAVQGLTGPMDTPGVWRALQAYAYPRVVLLGGYSMRAHLTSMGRTFNLRSLFVGDGEPHTWPNKLAGSELAFREEFSVAVCDGVLYVSNGCDQHIYPERSDWSHHYLADGDCCEGDYQSPENEFATMLRYDFVRGEWSTCRVPAPPKGFEASTAGSLGSVGSRLIYSGGSCEPEVNEEEEEEEHDPAEETQYLLQTAHLYDQATDSWTAIAPMSRTRYYHTSCGFNGKLYVTGGHLESPFSVERYDPEQNVWEPVADLVPYGFAVPLARRSVGYDCVHLICCDDSLYFVRVESTGGGGSGRRRGRTEVTLQEYREADDRWLSVDVIARETDVNRISLRTPVVAASGKIILFGNESGNAEPSMLTIDVRGESRGVLVSKIYRAAEKLTWAVGAVVPAACFPEAQD